MKRTAIAAAVAALLAGTAHAAITEMHLFRDPNFQGPSQVIKGEVANLEGGFNREVSSMILKGGFWEICNQDHFKGQCHVLEAGEYPRLGPEYNNRVVSVRFLGTDPKVTQRNVKEPVREARREERRDAREDRREDRREWRIGEGAIDLYGRPDFRGRTLRVEESVADLWERKFDGRASSAVVHQGTWQLCSEPEFRGRCATLRPGEYAQLAELDDRVSSIRRLR